MWALIFPNIFSRNARTGGLSNHFNWRENHGWRKTDRYYIYDQRAIENDCAAGSRDREVGQKTKKHTPTNVNILASIHGIKPDIPENVFLIVSDWKYRQLCNVGSRSVLIKEILLRQYGLTYPIIPTPCPVLWANGVTTAVAALFA